MKKIILVNPPLTPESRYGNLAKGGVYMPPLALGVLAATVRKSGFMVKILDCEALGLNIEEAADSIISFYPDYIGITAVTMAIDSAASLSAAVKRSYCKAKIILGGIHISVLPKETMALYKQFDAGVLGAGEETLVELLGAFAGNTDLEDIKGIIFRKNGSIIKTLPRPIFKNIDDLPFPAWDMYPELKKFYRPSAFGFKKLPCMSIITSRGCPFRCSFCSKEEAAQGFYLEHGIGYVREMIKELYHKFGIRDLAIYDGTFGVNQERLLNICEMLIRENLGLVWSCNFRVDKVNRRVLKAMKRAGCWGIAYGIESGSQEILDFLRKDTTLEMIADAVRQTKEAGIAAKGYIMIGTPLETKESIYKTLDFVLNLELDLLTINSFTPFPGSLDYERADRFGSFNKDWKLLNQHHLVFVPYNLSKKELDYYIRFITRKFYLRPKILFKFAKMLFNPAYFKLLLKGLVSFLKFITNKIQ